MVESRSRVRLFVDAPLSSGCELALDRGHAHYLLRVMRQSVGDHVSIFNGRDGEWQVEISGASKNHCTVLVDAQTRPQTNEPRVCLVFAPIKKTRLNFLVEKATELGVSRLQPVLTKHTDVVRVNKERLVAIAHEAAEQCERLSIPVIEDPVPFDVFLANWDQHQKLIYMDETGSGRSMQDAVGSAGPTNPGDEPGLLVGPEGGFLRF